MKKFRKDILAMLLVLAGFMLWSGAAARYRELDSGYGGISLRFEKNPLDVDSLAEIYERQKAAGTDSKLAAWRQDYNIKIQDPALGAGIESDVIFMWGDEKDVLGSFGGEGCAMSCDKAYELWGSRDVLGKNVNVGGAKYQVTSVINNIPGIIAVRKDNYEKDMKFVSLDMKPQSGEDESVRMEEFMLQNSKTADSTINYSDLLSLAGNFCGFPALTISALMCGKILYGIYCCRKNEKGCRTIAYYVFFLSSWICICIYSGSIFFEIPSSFIPTKWSDFDFWSALIKRCAEALNGLRLMRTYALDSYIKNAFIYILTCSLLSSACFIAALRYVKNESMNKLIVFETVFAVIMFCATVAAGAQYGRYTRAYWIILPMYFVFDCLISNFKLYERT